MQAEQRLLKSSDKPCSCDACGKAFGCTRATSPTRATHAARPSRSPAHSRRTFGCTRAISPTRATHAARHSRRQVHSRGTFGCTRATSPTRATHAARPLPVHPVSRNTSASISKRVHTDWKSRTDFIEQLHVTIRWLRRRSSASNYRVAPILRGAWRRT